MKKWSLILIISVAVTAAIGYFFRPGTNPSAEFIPSPVPPKKDRRALELYQRLDTFFTERSIKNGFSGSVLISVKGQPVYEKCFGWCDYRNKDLMHDTTAFQLASVSKNFTATAILWCAERQLLSLDDSLQKFFPELPYKGVTVKQLLCHRSGLPNYLYFCSSRCNKGEYITNDEAIRIMAITRPAAYARPDKRFEYSNTNYLLLASIVEKATGRRFHDFMKETFFTPLNMKHTFVYDFADSSNRKTAISYNTRWQIQYDDCFDGVVGDKGIYSTAGDMFKWDMAFYNGRLLSQNMLREAYTPRSHEHRGIRNYGYGWRLIQKPDGEQLVYHNGWWHGNNTVFFRNIQDTSSIIILSNKYNRYVYNIRPVLEIMYGTLQDTTGFGDE